MISTGTAAMSLTSWSTVVSMPYQSHTVVSLDRNAHTVFMMLNILPGQEPSSVCIVASLGGGSQSYNVSFALGAFTMTQVLFLSTTPFEHLANASIIYIILLPLDDQLPLFSTSLAHPPTPMAGGQRMVWGKNMSFWRAGWVRGRAGCGKYRSFRDEGYRKTGSLAARAL